MFHFTSPGRRAARALLAPASGLVLLAGVVPASAATAPAVRATHGAPALRNLSTLRGLRALPGLRDLPGLQGGPAATASTVTLEGGGATVKTSNGTSWTMTMDDSNEVGGLGIGIGRTVTAGGTGDEEHLWTFNSKASSLTFNKTTGDATVVGGSATGKVATIDVTFKATSHKAGTCSTGSETVYTGTLSGEAELVTGLSGGGTVGGKSISFDGAGFTPEVTVDSDCVVNIDECTASTFFVSGTSAGPIEAVGIDETVSGKLLSEVSDIRELKLSTPKGAMRDDITLVQAAPLSWDSKTGVLSATSTSSGIVTGSATLSGGKSTTTSFSCTWKGKTYKVTSLENLTANYASPAGKAITAHNAIGGNVAAPTSAKDAGFFVTTVS
jgi:hypothetical protein